MGIFYGARKQSLGVAAVTAVVWLTALWPTRAGAAWLTAPDGERVFVRGLAFSPYHPREGWQRSAGTRAVDRNLILRLGANCLIVWEEMSYDQIAAWHELGVYTLPQVVYTPKVLSRFASGQPSPIPIYVSQMNQESLYTAGRDIASTLKENPGVLAVSLGNDYAWSAFSKELGFSYGGWDTETLAAYQGRLEQRFGSILRFQELTGGEERGFHEVRPSSGLGPSPLFGEWWLFMRDAFAGFLKRGWEGVQAVGADLPTTYQRPCGIRWDPASEGSDLPFNEIVSGNVFYKDSLDWGKFCVSIDRLISVAHGRPVMVTETGRHTLNREPDPTCRILKQSVACALLHAELAGVGIYEYCDEWQHAEPADEQSDFDDREHWGLVTGHRAPKATYGAAAEMFGLIKRHESLFQQWQAPPAVLVSQQDYDWWKVRGMASRTYEKVARELYRQGASFRLVDTEGLLSLDPVDHPRLILCDTYLFSNPDMSQDVAGRIISYVENGGNLLYISGSPWQRLYGEGTVPEELAVPEDRAPTTRNYGKGQCTLIPNYGVDERAMSYVVADYLGEVLTGRPVQALETTQDADEVFWRLFEGPEGLWLFAVNVSDHPIGRIEIKMDPGFDARKMALRAGDGARVTRAGEGMRLLGLGTYALIYLGQRPAPVPVAEGEGEPEGVPAVTPNADAGPVPAREDVADP